METAGGTSQPSTLRRIGPLAGGAAVVLVLGFGIAWGGRSIQEPPMASGTATPADGPRLQPDPSGEKGKAALRPVDAQGPEQVRRRLSGGWEREAPRPPLGPSALAALPPKEPAPVAPPAPDPGTPRPTLLFGPIVPAAGRIEAAGHVIELEGVEVVDPARRCEGRNGGSWPCGTVSRAAFRAWVRGRAVECVVAPQPSEEPVLSLCRLGGKDMAAWLVANGLAEAKPGSAYEQAAQEARAARRGIFGDRPPSPGALPAPVPATLDGEGLEAASSDAGAAVPPQPSLPEVR